MDFELTKEQQQLVIDNHNLIYDFMYKKHIPFDSNEDWYGTLAIALCKAAKTFDSKWFA